MQFCRNCGSAIKESDTFCNKCGEQVQSAKPTGTYGSNQSYPAPGSQPPYTQQSYPAQKKFYRSPDDKVIAGVCGGLAEYFSMDPVLVRIGFVIFVLFGPGLFAYLILALLVPERPINYEKR